MFSEPQNVTVNAATIALPRTAFGDRNGLFESVTDGLRLRISHVLGKRTRRQVRLDFTKTAADPLLDGVSRQYSMSAYLVIDQPQVGFDAVEIEANAKVLTDWLAVPGNLTKVANGES
jgi:hypothetical protein